jgi:hypothetical protein
MTEEEIMKQWDYWRGEIANGHKGSAPRDWFESILDHYEDKLDKIKRWCDAYPIDIFPEPDLKKAAKILKENGMTLDAISASNMRHVLSGVKRIIEND